MTIPKQIKACLFDMDGLLLNSEDIYTITTSKVLGEYGKGQLTWDVKIKLQGLPGPEAAKIIVDTYDLPMSVDEYIRRNVELQEELWPTCSFLPGTLELLQHLKEKNIPIALCTSSNKLKFDGKTSHLPHGFSLFDAVITGDDPRIPKGRGKPHPNIWQVGLKELNEKFGTEIKPDECLVFEDGVIGVTSGKAFGASVIWVPHPESIPYLGNTDDVIKGHGEMLKSMTEFSTSKYGL